MRTRTGFKLLIFAVLFVAFGAFGFYLTESPAHPEYTLLDGLWWALVTMTTVGYGDYYPETPIGRFFVAFPAMVAGGGVIAYSISVFATALIDVKARELRGMKTLNLTDHIVLVNWPGTAKVLDMVQELQHDETQADCAIVVLTDEIEELPEELVKLQVKFVRGAPINDEALARACVKTASSCVVFASDERDENSDSYNLGVLVGLQATETEANIVAECVAPQHRSLMRKAGAAVAICVGELSTLLLAQASQGEKVQDLFSDLASNRTPQQVDVVGYSGKGAQRFGELARQLCEDDILLIGIDRDGKQMVNPGVGFEVRPGDSVVIIAGKRVESVG